MVIDMNAVVKSSEDRDYVPLYGYSDFYLNYSGKKKVKENGYLYIYEMGMARGVKGLCFRMEHRVRAELAFGGSLPPKSKVHHHNANQLVICEDYKYHTLLHERTKEKGYYSLMWKNREPEYMGVNIVKYNKALL